VAGSYGSAMSRVQGMLLEALMQARKADVAGGRRAFTYDLADIVVELACALKPDLALEIGANEATFSQRVKAALPDSRVVAFEANPTLYPTRSIAPLAAGVEYLPLCVSDRLGPQEFRVPVYENRPNRSMGSMLSDMRSSDYLSYQVEAVTLDGFLGPGAASANVMWVDVEGAVGRVIEGATEALGHCLLFYAELESVPRWEGQHTDEAIIEVLAAYGLTPLLRDVQRANWQYNCLFIRSELAGTPAVEKAVASFGSLVHATTSRSTS
jgi:FkbM family methyltransferase